ncbi:hypothetical protein FB45DRAFT_992047 [Roridomyces roridus]|uniref:RRM domain-containing protein n=1 Tax=Roridomyces roridus TaxID=1738132 RepID=A0AAD7BIB1_9AGAR|nr:hypothetical protein FB45DRAFT_992047 [Roridomyces roridus]
MAPTSAMGGIGIPSDNRAPGRDDDRDRDRDRDRDDDRRRARSRSPGRGGGRDGERGQNPGNNLHVSGLSHKVETQDLESAFAKIGRVQKASVMYDPHTRESRGFGFVTMESVEEADAATTALNGTEIMGKVIKVEKARRARGRTPTPGRYHGPAKREGEREYNPRAHDSRYSRDDRRGGGGGGGRGRYDDGRGGGGRDDYRGGGGGRDYDRGGRREEYSRDDGDARDGRGGGAARGGSYEDRERRY